MILSEPQSNLAELRRVRDELQEEFNAVSHSVRWLRSEQRALERALPKAKAVPAFFVACGLGLIVAVGLAFGVL